MTFLGITFKVIDDYLIIEDMNQWIVFVMNLFVMFGVYRYAKNRNFDKRLIFVVNQVFVTFGVYLIIEIQTRYCYNVQIAVFILAALGVEEIGRIAKKLWELRKVKESERKEELNA